MADGSEPQSKQHFTIELDGRETELFFYNGRIEVETDHFVATVKRPPEDEINLTEIIKTAAGMLGRR